MVAEQVEIDPTPTPGQASLVPCEPGLCAWEPTVHADGRTRWECLACGTVEQTTDGKDPDGGSGGTLPFP